MQNIFLKFILLISSVISVNAALAIPLSSVISTDTQQVEYAESHSELSLSTLYKYSKEQLCDVLTSENSNETYLYSKPFTNLFDNAFNLYKESLSLINTLMTRQKLVIQKETFQNVFVILHLRFVKNLYQVQGTTFKH